MNIIPASGPKVSPKNESQHFHAFVSQGAREGGLILTVAACLFLFMALFSHSPADPGWMSTGTNDVPVNYGGRAGAWFSDILLYFFGHVSYLFPLLIGYRACLIFKQRQHRIFHWPMFSVRIFGFGLTLAGATALMAIYSVAGLGQSSGGVAGITLSRMMLANFNLLGSTLLLVTMLLFGLTVFTGISWMGLMDRTGAITVAVARRVGHVVANNWYRFQDYRALRKEQRAKEQAEQNRQKPKPRTERVINAEPAAEHEENSSALKRAVGKIKDNLLSSKQEQSAESERIEPQMDAPVQVKAKAVKTSSGTAAAPDEKGGIKIAPFVKKSKQSKRLEDEKQGSLFIASEGPLPPLSLLDPPDRCKKKGYSKETLEHMSRLLEEKLADFGVSAEVVEVNPGPVITRFEIQPAAGVKVSKISNLAKDLARSLAVLSVRVVEVIPGKSVVGIEIPNEHRQIVRFSEVLQSSEYDDAESPVTLGLGNDIAGDPVVANLAKMPHLLVAGTTGSGKSVGVNSMILSMLFKATPEQVRFIMVDPKMLELSIYDGIPHLLTPVVTDMKEAANALRWCVAEMERRYKLMANLGVRNIAGYNRKVNEGQEKGEPLLDPLWNPEEHLLNEEQERPELETLPFIVVVIDEFADMMMIVGKKVEELIARIAQKARAAGIHLILATQRPSVDVITGLIKANVPTRISFQVSSKIDSRTVLDQGGAEMLLGHGDMLYMPPGTSVPIRVHGAFVDDHEVHKVVDDWKQRGEPDYLEEVLTGGESSDPIAAALGDDGDSEQDPLYDEAVAFVTETRRVSISSVQRKLKIGYNRSANLVEAMEQAGVVSSAGHNGAREVLAPAPPKD
ncbi:MAG: cell division protein FtsK [Oleiphilus sp.]|nr:MAG: cell division protein FtsK [Oleiphilus sp.]